MLKKAGVSQIFAINLTLFAALFASGQTVAANEQEQYVPADTHFYMGTGRKMPVDHLLALVPQFDLPESAEGAEALENIMGMFDNPAERLAEWGIDSDIQMSMYSVGILPVVRLALKDSTKFESALDALEKEHDVESRKLKGKDLISRFYSIDTISKIGKKVEEAAENASDESDENTASSESGKDDMKEALEKNQTSAGLLIANDGVDVIVSFISDGEDTTLIDAVTGVTKPAKSIAESGKLKQLRKQWAYGDEMVSFVDMQQIAATMTGHESTASKQLSDLFRNEPKALQGLGEFRSEPCRAEITSIASLWPMFVSGTRKFEVNEKEVSYDSHMAVVVKHELLRDTLLLLRGVVPTSQSSSEAMVSVGLGITVDKLAQAVGQFSQLLASMNYQCSRLSGLNDLAKSDLSAASMGVVMFGGLARGVQGLAFNVFDVEVAAKGSPEPLKNVDTAIAVSAADPALLVQTLKMMPQLGMLSELPLDGTELVLNPLLPIPVPENIQIKAAIKGKNIVIYSGEKGTDYANRMGGNDTDGFFQTRVNTRLIMDKIRAVMEMAGQDSEELKEIMAIMDAYPKGDLNYLVDFTKEGIELNVGGTFDIPAK